VLVVDDDPGLRKSATLILEEAGYEVLTASEGDEGLSRAREVDPDLILCDVRMPGIGGLEFLEKYREEGGDALVLVTTAYGSFDLAVEAMKKGAYDYLPKPFGADELLLTIRKAEEREELRKEVGRLRTEVRADRKFGEIVARSPAMLEALEMATKVAAHPAPVLISGASGTGKELVARLIHREGDRADGPFVPVNCGAIPENLLESEFFGYMKGSFSGADRDKAGLFEAADGGTLFLDEIAELPLPLQVKLLRALQEGEIRRVGGTETLSVDVRIIAATNKDLEQLVKDGEFREDLYYRLAVVPIHLPALRRRTDEIPELVHHLLERHGRRLAVEVDGIDPDAMEVLLEYPWPGNIRELENVLERALVISEGGRIDVEHLPAQVRDPSPDEMPLDVEGDDLSVKRRTAELERHLIQRALKRTEGNRTQAAELLDLSPRALRYKIKDYGLD
ncbi:MAG TPA: sigma-54 dependent transcriptional regulator, partial [Longimicrobiales bacterium]|nr:sigma-54 dependent transcriptional regulator [Longimicrobiales bacterium]